VIRFILNVLWFICGGLLTGLGWLLAGVLLAIVHREVLGRVDIGTGPLGTVLNVIWFILAGWWLALGHVVLAVAEGISIIGIPFAIKDLQLAYIALAPIGRDVVRR
jgi:uncharacterized membrane protein YccF (DUF307 family)